MAVNLGQVQTDRAVDRVLDLIRTGLRRRYPAYRLTWMRVLSSNLILFVADEVQSGELVAETTGRSVQVLVPVGVFQDLGSIRGEELAEKLVDELMDKIQALEAGREFNDEEFNERFAEAEALRKREAEERRLAAENLAAAVEVDQLVVSDDAWGAF